MTSDFENLAFLKLLLSVDGIGPQRILSLISYFKEPKFIFTSSIAELSKIDGISRTLSQRILNPNSSFEQFLKKFESEQKSLEKINARIISYWDTNYPALLRRIYYPPILLYTLGEFTSQDQYAIAIVGTRQPTNYGKMQTELLTKQLVQRDLTIVSGLARGIDSIAHKSALKNNGRTIAVIGSGLDVIYPPENKKLFEEIIQNGIVITEYELGTKPDAQNFPRRNRIISGLSLGTLIVETKINGGAMQTAAYAIDQNREIFALPGNINVKQSEGPNSLIQKGEAKLVINADDILNELNIKIKPEVGKNIPKPNIELNLFEERIIQLLDNEPKHIDEISSLSSLSISDCLVNLLTLEFKGVVKQLPGKMFLLAD
ncbi:MAG: DNA-processing protein DprA [Bacteroidota bacterium]